MKVTNKKRLPNNFCYIQNILFESINFIFACSMVFIMFILLFLSKNLTNIQQREFIFPNYILIVAMLIIFIIIFTFHRKKTIKINTDKIIVYTVFILFFVQLYIFYNIFFESGWDVATIRNTALDISNEQYSTNSSYYDSYPNNMLITSLCSIILRMNNSLGIFFGEYSTFCLVVVNCLISSFTSYLTYSIMKRLINKNFAFIGYLFYIGLIIFSPWNVILYSDSISLLFPVLILYLFINNNMKTYYKYTYIFSLGYLGFKIKPQCIIIVIAIMICLFIKNFPNFHKHLNKKFLLTIILSSISVFFLSNSIVMINENNGMIENENSKIGMMHFLMMGLNPNTKGIYNHDDVIFTKSYSNTTDRNLANLRIAKQRLSDMGVKGIIHLICDKALINFNDGTFAWGLEGDFYQVTKQNVNSKISPRLKNFYYTNINDSDNNNFKYYATTVQFLWINVLFLIFYKGIKQVVSKDMKKDYPCQVVILSLLGITLFELIFEARARYLYSYAPLFIVASIYGIKELYHDFNKIKI